MNDLTFGWFLPTSGDTTCLANNDERIPQSPELFDDVVKAVDNGGYKYLLMPVNATCWEAEENYGIAELTLDFQVVRRLTAVYLAFGSRNGVVIAWPPL